MEQNVFNVLVVIIKNAQLEFWLRSFTSKSILRISAKLRVEKEAETG